MAKAKRPKGEWPLPEEGCPLCFALAYQPHKADCPWRLWRERKRAKKAHA